MKESELREHMTCHLCHKKIGHVGVPLFWTVKIERHGLLADVIQRQDGLAAMLGNNAYLAMHMGTDEEMTQTVLGPVEITVCEKCATEESTPLMVMAMAGDVDDG